MHSVFNVLNLRLDNFKNCIILREIKIIIITTTELLLRVNTALHPTCHELAQFSRTTLTEI